MGVFVLYDIYIKTYYNMKHLLNDLSEEERNSIREQHTGGMKVMTENFKKLINTKQGDVKTLLEQEDDEDESGVDDEVANDEVEPSEKGLKDKLYDELQKARVDKPRAKDFVNAIFSYDTTDINGWDSMMFEYYKNNSQTFIPFTEGILDLISQIKNK
tara:strand:+ start:754 stop:1227 length:474 start_codon:yes stop_codon:yes gene_type:complete